MTTQPEKLVITVSATVSAPPERVWDLFTSPMHIIHWNNASDDWQTSYAENDLKPGGKFLSRMEARDGSEGFDFNGRYSEVIPEKTLAYTIADGRNVHISRVQSRLPVLRIMEKRGKDPIPGDKRRWQNWRDGMQDQGKHPGEILKY